MDISLAIFIANGYQTAQLIHFYLGLICLGLGLIYLGGGLIDLGLGLPGLRLQHFQTLFQGLNLLLHLLNLSTAVVGHRGRCHAGSEYCRHDQTQFGTHKLMLLKHKIPLKIYHKKPENVGRQPFPQLPTRSIVSQPRKTILVINNS